MARYSENTVAEVGIAAKSESSTIRNLLDRFDKELELFGLVRFCLYLSHRKANRHQVNWIILRQETLSFSMH